MNVEGNSMPVSCVKVTFIEELIMCNCKVSHKSFNKRSLKKTVGIYNFKLLYFMYEVDRLTKVKV